MRVARQLEDCCLVGLSGADRARLLLDLRGRLDLAGDAVLPPADGPGRARGLERADRLAVGADGAVERAPHLREVPREGSEALVELGAELVHRLCALGDRLLLPDGCDRAEQRHQRARRCQHDAPRPCVLTESAVVLVRDAEQRLVRDEHHHEVRRANWRQ